MDSKKCPFKKVVSITFSGYKSNKKVIKTDFAECDGVNCQAAIWHTDCYNTNVVTGCRLMPQESKR